MTNRVPDRAGRHELAIRRMGIDTYNEPIVYLRRDSAVCRAEGFEAQARIRLSTQRKSIIATLNVVSAELLDQNEAGLSEAAWRLLSPVDGEHAHAAHPEPVHSLSAVRGKIHGEMLGAGAIGEIVRDVAAGRYSPVETAAFLTACAGERMSHAETVALTRAMLSEGRRLSWPKTPIVDKHCIGGLPGNRTTPMVVAIVAAAGLVIPKTSSRAITSPAGTADTMEVLTPVELDLAAMRRVVEKEGGCLVWGGGIGISPVDDILIRIERLLDFDSDGQLAASVLSKKAAAGSTHVVIDMPVGPTAKVRSAAQAARLSRLMTEVGAEVGLCVEVLQTDGTAPVGRGIGPALEARDVLQVLQCESGAPLDLRARSIALAAAVLEMGGRAPPGAGSGLAAQLLDSGQAWSKFQAICAAQGGLRTPPRAAFQRVFEAPAGGRLSAIDNRRLARIAKLSGAPKAPAAGVELHVALGSAIERGQPLLTLHAESRGALDYAAEFAEEGGMALTIEA